MKDLLLSAVRYAGYLHITDHEAYSRFARKCRYAMFLQVSGSSYSAMKSSHMSAKTYKQLQNDTLYRTECVDTYKYLHRVFDDRSNPVHAEIQEMIYIEFIVNQNKDRRYSLVLFLSSVYQRWTLRGVVVNELDRFCNRRDQRDLSGSSYRASSISILPYAHLGDVELFSLQMTSNYTSIRKNSRDMIVHSVHTLPMAELKPTSAFAQIAVLFCGAQCTSTQGYSFIEVCKYVYLVTELFSEVQDV